MSLLAIRRASGRTSKAVLALSLALAAATAAYVALIPQRPVLDLLVAVPIGLATIIVVSRVTRAMSQARWIEAAELARTQKALVKHRERLKLLHEIDRAIAAGETPKAIAGAAIQPLRELLEVPRAIVNMFDLAAGQVEWLAAAGRKRTHIGPGVRYSIRLMGDVEALKRGEPQLIDTYALPAGREKDALLASGVELYMAVPMIAGGELIGALSFGGAPGPFPPERVSIAQEAATQLAIVIMQARLRERVTRQADELEAHVRERTQELEAAVRELETFSYSVSHDLRAPLRSINGFSQMLLERYEERLDADGQRYLARIRGSTRRMGELIDDLLQLAQVGRADLNREPVDISELARTVIGALRAGEPGRIVRCEIQDGLTVEADRRLVRVALENLLGNAWKFTAKSPQPRIDFGSATATAGLLTYFVRDNGAGFDMTYAAKLFRPFQRLHEEAEFAGTGIGLATVHRIVTRHGGRVWAEGRVNSGATIFFTLSAGAAVSSIPGGTSS